MNASTLGEAIRELWSELERLDRPIVGQRSPGVDTATLERAFDSGVPADVAAWFAMCNGVAHHPGQAQDDAALIPGYEPLSIEEAAAMKTDYGDSFPILGHHWIPLLASGGADFYAAVFDAETPHPKVVSVMPEVKPRLAFHSIEQMVRTFTRCYREGVFFFNEEEAVLDADDDRWMEIEEEAAQGESE